MRSPAVRWELERWFSSLSPDGRPRVERLGAQERALPVLELLGARGFFTDANACIARAAWSAVPFREVPYAEDRVLAIDMLRGGYAKAFVPDAQRCCTPTTTPPASSCAAASTSGGGCARSTAGASQPRRCAWPGSCVARSARRDARRCAKACRPAQRSATLATVGCHQALRLAGALLGSRADRLSPGVRRRLSLEGRATFVPLGLDDEQAPSSDPALRR